MVWTFQYYNGSSWVNIANAVIDHIVDELNGQLELDFIIPNIPANLAFVQTNQQVRLLWGSTYGSGTVVFSGLLMAYTATFTQLACTVYNDTFEAMQKIQVPLVNSSGVAQTMSHANNGPGGYNNVAANLILVDICAACDMTAGSCPTTPVSITFNGTDCLTAATNLANILCGTATPGEGYSLYNSGSTVNIAVKGNQTPTAITVDTQSSVNIDRSKTGIVGVIIRGVSPTGQVIIGTAGNVTAGNNTVTLTNNSVTSQASLNALAAAYLQSLAETNSGCPLEADIAQTAGLNSGDMVTVSNGAKLGLSGSYAIYRITKNLTKSTLEVVTPAGAFLALITQATSINGVISSLANNTNSLQTLNSGSDSNLASSAYLTLVDPPPSNDVLTLVLGYQTAPSNTPFMSFSSANVTYLIPYLSQANGSAATATITPSVGSPYSAPMIGLGTYKYPFLWVDAVFVFADYLKSLESAYLTLQSPLATGNVGSASVGSSGQFLQSQGSGAPPIWASYSPGGWNGGTVTANITLSGALWTIFDNGYVPSDNLCGLTWYSSSPTAYGIYREAGAWGAPYPNLHIQWTTGVVIDCSTGYNGISIAPSGANTTFGGEVGIKCATPYIDFYYAGVQEWQIGMLAASNGTLEFSINAAHTVVASLTIAGMFTTYYFNSYVETGVAMYINSAGAYWGTIENYTSNQWQLGYENVQDGTLNHGGYCLRWAAGGYLYSRNNTLDNGSGNMTVAGETIFQYTGNGLNSFQVYGGASFDSDISLAAELLFNYGSGETAFLEWINAYTLYLGTSQTNYSGLGSWTDRHGNTVYYGALNLGAIYTNYLQALGSTLIVGTSLNIGNASLPASFNVSGYDVYTSGNIYFNSTHIVSTGGAFCLDQAYGGMFYFRIDNPGGNINACTTVATLDGAGNWCPNNCNPYGGNNTGGVGGGSSAWNGVICNTLYYSSQTHGSYDLIDDFAVLRGMKNKKLSDGKLIIDPDSLSVLKAEHDPSHPIRRDENIVNFYHAGNVNGFVLSSMKRVVLKLDEQELVNDRFREELDAAKLEINDLRLQLDVLKVR